MNCHLCLSHIGGILREGICSNDSLHCTDGMTSKTLQNSGLSTGCMILSIGLEDIQATQVPTLKL